MIAELQAEKQRLDEAIVALERLSAGKLRTRNKHDDAPISASESSLHDVNAVDGAGEEFPRGSLGPN